MKRSVALLLPFVLVACQDARDPVSPDLAQAPGAEPSFAVHKAGKQIEGSYIVVLKPEADVDAKIKTKELKKLKHVHKAVLRGFAAELTPEQLEALRSDPMVDYIEPDQVVTANATQSNATWGLDRINQRKQPLDGSYTYGYNGSGVWAYVIDTGLQANHPQFGSRARNVYDALGGNGADCNGHGTHVAGTIGGSSYGVAKNVQLRGVRVLGCDGSGSTSGIIAAVDWVRSNAVRPAIANMSLGGGYSSALNTAISNLANSGVFVAVAAGNENQNACNVSPASAAAAYTVAASDRTDTRASFSNYGSCVDAYAPGVDITSAWIGSRSNTISGTSMASPHVAGVAALIKDRYGDIASSTVTTYLDNALTTGVIRSNVSGTANALLYKYVPAW